MHVYKPISTASVGLHLHFKVVGVEQHGHFGPNRKATGRIRYGTHQPPRLPVRSQRRNRFFDDIPDDGQIGLPGVAAGAQAQVRVVGPGLGNVVGLRIISTAAAAGTTAINVQKRVCLREAFMHWRSMFASDGLAARQQGLQPVDEFGLGGQYPFSGGLWAKPGAPVYFRKGKPTARLPGPL